MKNCIFISFDDNYYEYAKVCINSIKANYPEHPLVMVYYMGSDSKVVHYLDSIDNLQIVKDNFHSSKYNYLNMGVGSSVMHGKFFLWEEYFQQFDNIVYLDCDVVVLKPFPELFDTNDFFAVSDFSDENIFDPKSNQQELEALAKTDNIELKEIDTYMINGGVMAVPKRFRSVKYHRQIWYLIKRYNNYTSHYNQSIISLWTYLNKISISRDIYYNFQIHHVVGPIAEFAEIDSIKILHYSQWKQKKNQ